jgi:hypothetical protein
MTPPILLLVLSLLGPSAPMISGPRSSEHEQVVYVFSAHERGVPAALMRFRCAVDSIRLRACPRRYGVLLSVGVHTLRARAVDPRGRSGPVRTARITILEPRAPEVRVGSAPLNAIVAQGIVWTENYGDGTIPAARSWPASRSAGRRPASPRLARRSSSPTTAAA